MTRLYLIRHCEAQGNLMRVFQGLSDFDISETGARQLEFLGKRFADIHIDRLYSSPLKRAMKTAQAVADAKGMTVEPYSGIREINVGSLEGQNIEQVFKNDPKLYDVWKNHPQDFVPENGEPMKNTYERIWDAIQSLARENKGKTIAAATHGGVTRCLLCRLLYGSIEYLYKSPWCDNTAVSLIEFDDNFNPTLVFYNDVSHLPQELLPSASRIQSIMDKE